MLFVEINNLHGLCVPEGRIEDTVETLVRQLSDGHAVVPLGQYELVLGIRMAVKHGRLDDIRFIFNDVIVPILPDGQLMFWPAGFPGDQMDSYLSQLI